jgi:hypothetical protein
VISRETILKQGEQLMAELAASRALLGKKNPKSLFYIKKMCLPVPHSKKRAKPIYDFVIGKWTLLPPPPHTHTHPSMGGGVVYHQWRCGLVKAKKYKLKEKERL